MNKFYVADLETTLLLKEDNPTSEVCNLHQTWCWGYGLVSNEDNNVEIGNSMQQLFYRFNEIAQEEGEINVFFHNLKFDGSFIVYFLLRYGMTHKKDFKTLENHEFTTSISSLGQWYQVIYKYDDKLIKIYDSLKLLPFSVENIAKSFRLKNLKGTIDHTIFRGYGYEPTEEEKEYIINDVLIVKDALNIFFAESPHKLTIASCALSKFKEFVNNSAYTFNELFPPLHKQIIDELTEYDIVTGELISSTSVYDYCKKSYRGGWTYVNSKYKEKLIEQDMVTYDVNSLYPYIMMNRDLPRGKGFYFDFEYEKTEKMFNKVLESKNMTCIIRFKCEFNIKDGYLPFIQIKNNWLYHPRQHLTTSNVEVDGKFHRKLSFYALGNEHEYESQVELTLCLNEYLLFHEHYNIENLELLDMVVFYTQHGMFDDYLEHYKNIKINTDGAIKQIAKLYSNSLYGKISTSDDSSYKVPYLDEDWVLKFEVVKENEKSPVHIACGSFITAYAREYTIRHAQMNYNNFIYADTDSLHLLGTNYVGLELDENEYGKWSVDKESKRAIYIRAKSYIQEDHNGDLNITCAGMPKNCKQQFIENYKIEDFKVGLKLDGKLQQRQVVGGLALLPTTFEIKGAKY